jgi:hypothetical protein
MEQGRPARPSLIVVSVEGGGEVKDLAHQRPHGLSQGGRKAAVDKVAPLFVGGNGPDKGHNGAPPVVEGSSEELPEGIIGGKKTFRRLVPVSQRHIPVHDRNPVQRAPRSPSRIRSSHVHRRIRA